MSKLEVRKQSHFLSSFPADFTNVQGYCPFPLSYERTHNITRYFSYGYQRTLTSYREYKAALTYLDFILRSLVGFQRVHWAQLFLASGYGTHVLLSSSSICYVALYLLICRCSPSVLRCYHFLYLPDRTTWGPKLGLRQMCQSRYSFG